MKKALLLLFVVSLASCSSVKTIKVGKKYEVDCHMTTTSDYSCAEKVKDSCRNGYNIEKSVTKYKLLTGLYRSLTVSCK